jgi:serine phosphatase RsbU (regulator of sigma subunit)
MLFANKEFTHNLTKDWNKNLALMMKAIGRPNQENCFNWLEARNSKSKQLFSTSNDSANERIENLNKVMSKISLEKFIPDRAKPKTQITNQAEFIIRTMLENPIIGFSSFFETPGKLKKMNFEGTDLYWYWNYIKDPKAKVAYICGNISLDQAIREYIDKISKNRFSLGNTSLRVKFYYSIENRWLDSEFKATDICQAMVKHSQITDQAINSKILLKNQKYLAVTFPGKKLKNLQILCLFPNKQIDLRISQMKTNIYIGVILILVVAILTGLLLTNSFLAPVGMLNQGIKALHRRETSFRLTIESSDELGELGEMFNQMMEEVNEMLLAGATQQCLIPKELPKIPGYELTLFNKMATDVGGDYCDALKLDENKFLIVLGDVTGHGVSSSLLTAMVKALVFQYSKTQGELPELLKCLSFMIFDLLKHRKLMTFCALILDTSKNEMMISNAGHPFPFLCSNEKFEGIEHTSLPLGVSKKRSKYDLTIRKIEPNQVFAMYTDGIAEATNIKGEVFGFDKVGKIICENIDSSSNAIKDKLLEEFWNHYSEPELDDDLTMVILKRVS